MTATLGTGQGALLKLSVQLEVGRAPGIGVPGASGTRGWLWPEPASPGAYSSWRWREERMRSASCFYPVPKVLAVFPL